ncbi:HD family phosphohydrolase [Anaerocolumna cellulosilytica]|uniref:HD family phosphohydrolase n=1 Tax=Anaerocolumna cellulosilytica TaxID=433286 RepID=A0A6S6R9Y5_9FIRM|nr:HD domain-containing protein [Anaerocolumna cellulosilytica]MBB5195081.1 HD superfamily phosphodiesterase [Anaerocolumna cellulosilytica]BCJ96082.1 HD family phosphohydrolase [Anaerocolumna cellulosilytica]
MKKIGKVIEAMIEYYTGDIRRINHFLKVYAYAKTIGELEQLEETMQEILEVTAVVHDIGIKISEEKYNSSAGTYQQIEGPGIARPMLKRLGYEEDFIDRVCFLIGHHHTYHTIDGLDYQILVEADFLVNLDEDKSSAAVIQNVKEKIFKTKAGFKILEQCFGKAR